MKAPILLSAAALLLFGTAAYSQETSPPPPPPDDPMAEPQPMEDVPMPPGPQEPARMLFSDTEVDSFAAAAVRMRGLRADADMDDAAFQAAAEAILADEGLNPETFTMMQTAAQTDPALAARIQLAIESVAEE